MPFKYENTIPLFDTLDTANSIMVDFKDASWKQQFYIEAAVWGHDNNGVHPYNVFWDSAASCVALKMRGSLNTEHPLTGAVLVSRFKVRPGRIEMRFKTTAPIGQLIALWTYTLDSDGNNHEVDIELPILRTGAQAITDYSAVKLGTYLSLAKHSYKNVILNKSLNDGEFHTIGFDWYNDKVIYYIDNVLACIITKNISDLENRIWCGGWIPNDQYIGGNPNFDEAWLFIDCIRYTPFVNQTYT
jgi:beta-glucanase (GH16 family)